MGTRIYAYAIYLNNKENIDENDVYYYYAMAINLMSLVHSVSTVWLSFMLESTLICRSRSGSQNQRTAVDKDIYQKTLLVTGITSALYILPLVGIFVYTYVYHSGSVLNKDSHSKIIANATLFATWISKTLNDTSEGVSLLFSFVLHLFIIAFLISLSTVASFIRSEEKNISQIREAHR